MKVKDETCTSVVTGKEATRESMTGTSNQRKFTMHIPFMTRQLNSPESRRRHARSLEESKI